MFFTTLEKKYTKTYKNHPNTKHTKPKNTSPPPSATPPRRVLRQALKGLRRLTALALAAAEGLGGLDVVDVGDVQGTFLGSELRGFLGGAFYLVSACQSASTKIAPSPSKDFGMSICPKFYSIRSHINGKHQLACLPPLLLSPNNPQKYQQPSQQLLLLLLHTTTYYYILLYILLLLFLLTQTRLHLPNPPPSHKVLPQRRRPALRLRARAAGAAEVFGQEKSMDVVPEMRRDWGLGLWFGWGLGFGLLVVWVRLLPGLLGFVRELGVVKVWQSSDQPGVSGISRISWGHKKTSAAGRKRFWEHLVAELGKDLDLYATLNSLISRIFGGSLEYGSDFHPQPVWIRNFRVVFYKQAAGLLCFVNVAACALLAVFLYTTLVFGSLLGLISMTVLEVSFVMIIFVVFRFHPCFFVAKPQVHQPPVVDLFQHLSRLDEVPCRSPSAPNAEGCWATRHQPRVGWNANPRARSPGSCVCQQKDRP